MNTTETRSNNSMDAAIASEFADYTADDSMETDQLSFDQEEAESIEEIAEPSIELIGGVAFLKNGAELPTEVCVKSGKKTYKVVGKSLRNPFNPATWFGKREKLNVGLCKNHYENFLVANAMTWSGVGVGALLMIAGIFTLSVLSIFAGIALGFGMGAVRAVFPVWAKIGEEEAEIEVHGLSPAYLKMIGG